MRSTNKPPAHVLDEPLVKELRKALREPFETIERALLPNDRPLSPDEIRILRTPIGAGPK